jgi:hypothetical protein
MKRYLSEVENSETSEVGYRAGCLLTAFTESLICGEEKLFVPYRKRRY